MDTRRAAAKPQRVVALDGVRGIAILLVLVNHFATGVEPKHHQLYPGMDWQGHGAGFVGVQLFFVLSGYLITSLLIKEFHRYSEVSFSRFYLRRARRLMPALITLCGIYGMYVALFDRPQMRLALGSIFRAITYTGNLPSFFPKNEALVHTWSLAVEEQFYLVWPIVLVGLLRKGQGQAVKVAIVVGIATIIGREMVPLILEGRHAPFLQYNLFRWDALMAGTLLALRPIRVAAWMGWLGIAVLVVLVAIAPAAIPGWQYTLSTFACAAIVATATQIRWLANRSLAHVGLISYSLYLWHVPLLRWGLPGPISLLLCFAVAEASYWWIELPGQRRLFRSADRPRDVSASMV